MRLSSRLLPLFAAVIFSAAAYGHDTWLAPADFSVERRTAVKLMLSSGMEFPKLDHAIQPDRVEVARLRTSRGKVVDLSRGTVAEHALVFQQKLSTPGVTVFWTVLHPRPSELKPEQVREYVEHLGLKNPESISSAWTGKPVKYRYTKFSKTFVRVGGREGHAWAQPAQMRLELVPLNDPTTARGGDTLQFRLIRDGRALTEYPVAVAREGATEAKTYMTDDSGVVAVDIPSPGRYMIKAATLEHSSAPEMDWDVDFTTATFEARAR